MCLACGSQKLLWKGIKTEGVDPSLEGNLQLHLHEGLEQQGQEVKGQASEDDKVVSGEWNERVCVVSVDSGALIS